MFHEILELPADRQSAYLDEACRNDPGLRAEVEELLSQSRRDDAFLKTLTLHVGRPAPGPPPSTGAGWKHYRILELIGEGGMATVHKGRDERLERTVAIKRMRPGVGSDPALTARLMNEAKTLSALDHPNICAIYDIGTDEEGRLFLVMPYYQGRTVKEMIAQAPLSTADAITIAVQVCQGLAKAHAAGIVHRDIKPANVIVTEDGIARILDFGIAKLAGRPGGTQAGMILGTVRYMSPEQISGEIADARTDLWAMGVVLFEMIAGRAPFSGDSTIALMNAIVHSEPAPLWSSGRDIPRTLEAVITRVLRKNPLDRYQSAQEMIDALKAIETGARMVGPEGAARSLAVLPLACLSTDPELAFFADGVTDEIINSLSREPRVRVTPRTTVFQFKNVATDMRELGRRLDVDSVLEGSIRASASMMRVSLQWVDVSSGGAFWSERLDESREDLFAAEDRISRAAVDAVRAHILKLEGSAPPSRPEIRSEAFRLLLKGRWHLARRQPGGLEEALKALRAAVDADPAYDEAWSTLAEAYLGGALFGWIPPGHAWESAREAVNAALRLAPDGGHARALHGVLTVFDGWNWGEAAVDFERAMRAASGNPRVRTLYAVAYLLPQGRLQEAVDVQLPALQKAPLAVESHMNMAWILAMAGRYEGAIFCARNALEIAPEMVEAPRSYTVSLVELGRFEQAIEVLESGLARHPEEGALLGLLAWAQARSGHADKAVVTEKRLSALSQERYVPATYRAWAMLASGRRDDALVALEQAADDREPAVIYLALLPMLSDLRSESRFQSLVDRIGLPH